MHVHHAHSCHTLPYHAMSPAAHGTQVIGDTQSPRPLQNPLLWGNYEVRRVTQLWVMPPHQTLGQLLLKAHHAQLPQLCLPNCSACCFPAEHTQTRRNTTQGKHAAAAPAPTHPPTFHTAPPHTSQVVYTSTRRAPSERGQPSGGRFRGTLGRTLFRTTGLFQSVLEPGIVTNKVGLGPAPGVGGVAAVRLPEVWRTAAVGGPHGACF